MTARLKIFFAIAALLMATELDTGRTMAETIVVGSKMDSEGALLGNMIADLLTAQGFLVERRLRFGPTSAVRAALLAGQIDIYPEYTGNGALFFDRQDDPAWKNAAEGYQLIKRLDRERNQLAWLTPAPANNTWVIAIRNDLPGFPARHCMGEFARYVNGGGKVKLEGSAEYVQSPAALPAYEDTYGFHLSKGQLVILPNGDTAVTLHAAAEQLSGVNAAMAYGTDGQVSTLGLITLCDDKGAQLVYAPAPVIRLAVLDRHPEIAGLLEAAFTTLTTEILQRLNAEIAVHREDPAVVATSYLKSIQLLP